MMSVGKSINPTDPCKVCRGACCETLVTPLTGSDKVNAWLAERGEICGRFIRLECRCKRLTREGFCSIYETRPEICREYPVGSPACIEAIRKRRSPLMLDVINRYNSEKESATN